MSLDVYLTTQDSDRCSACGRKEVSQHVFERNITHNLGAMAGEAGIYTHLWRPDECVPPITKASELISPLTNGLVLLKAYPERFKTLAPANGWGTYEGLVEFVRAYLAACEEWPDAVVSVSR